MAGGKSIARAFRYFGKPRDSPELAEGGKPVTPAGQQLMGIGLMADVPDQLVRRNVKYIVDGNGEFNDPEIG
jgi:hypothetical protein